MTPEEIKAMQDKNAALEKEIADLKKPPEKKEEAAPPPAEKTLGDKVKEEDERKAKDKIESQKVEAALRFDLNSDKFIADHKSVLPKSVSDIFAAAGKETYDSTVQKVSAIKASVIQEFFKVQANMDHTTEFQKTSIEDYLKLTKSGREEKAEEIWKSVLEPVLHMVKAIKKHEEVAKGRNGEITGDEGVQSKILERMTDLSKTHYGVK